MSHRRVLRKGGTRLGFLYKMSLTAGDLGAALLRVMVDMREGAVASR